MSVHYKFKSTLDYDTVSFDGLHISVADLKKAIFHQKRIGKNTDFDLQITNAQTKEDYTDDNALIAKNTSLIVARVPLTVQQKRSWDRNETPPFNNLKDEANLGRAVDLTRLDGSEEDKIRAMMTQSTQDYDPSNYMKIRGANQTGDVPANYRCYKCHQPGHWIKNCPLGTNQEPIEIKKSTGIPRSFMVPVEGPLVPGAMMTPTGHYAVPAIDHQAYKEGKKERPPFSQDPEPVVEKPEIPEDLLCNICKDLLTDAVMIPCCGNSFCDECIRTFLLESEEHECPDCNEKDVSPETLIPNRFLRNAVMNFKNETGYAKRQTYRPAAQSAGQPSATPTEQSKVETQQTASQVSPQTTQSSSIPSAPSQEPAEPPQPVNLESTSQQHIPATSSSVQPQTPSTLPEPTSESHLQSDSVTKLTTDEETEVPPPPGTEPLLPIPAIVSSPEREQERSQEAPCREKKERDNDYAGERQSRERRRSFSRDSHRERSGERGRRIENLRPLNRRRSLSPRHSQHSDYPSSSGVPPHLMNPPPSKGYQGHLGDDGHYPPAMHYDSGIRRSNEDRPGTPTVDEPHLHVPSSGNQPPLLPFPPGEERIPPPNYNQPPPNVPPHNPPLLPDPYMSHRIPIYPHQQGSHYGPPRYDRPPYQQQGYRPSQPPRNYNGPPRPLRGLHHMAYRGLQPPPPGLGRNIHNGNPPGIIDDPLEAFERMLREKDERDRRLGKHRRRSRTRSRSRSYSRSRSRSFGRRSPFTSRISRSRSPPSKRRSSRSPLPLRPRSRTPKRRSNNRSRSGSFSISRSRSYSRSQSPRLSPSRDRDRERDRERERERERDRERDRDRDRDRDRERDRDRDLLPRYRSPVRSPPRFQRERDRERERPRSREPRDGYNTYYSDSPAHDYQFRDRERDLPPRERPLPRYPIRNQSSQHNIPPLMPHLVTGGHPPPPLMSLGPPPTDRKDYYDSYNRYSGPPPPPSQRFGSPLRDPPPHKRFDDVAPPGTEGYYDLSPPGVEHSDRVLRDDRERQRPLREQEDREHSSKDRDNEERDRLPLRDDRGRDREDRRERDERDRRIVTRDREDRDRPALPRDHEDRIREKDERDRREKEKERDDRHIRDRRDDDRHIEKKDYDKDRYRDDRDRHRQDDKGRQREKERRDREYESEKDRDRHERYERRSVERKKGSRKSLTPYSQKSRGDVKDLSPERAKKKEKDHEEKAEEKKKEKKIKEKKKKKDSDEKEKKKKKKKEKKSSQKEAVSKDDSMKVIEAEDTLAEIKTMDDMSSSPLKADSTKMCNEEDNIESRIECMHSEIVPSIKEEFEDKSLAMNPEPPEFHESSPGRIDHAEFGTNPPNPNFKPIPELKSDMKPTTIDTLYGGLDDTEMNTMMTEKYSLMSSEHENDVKEAAPMEKSPKKDEFLAPVPELSKWERDDTIEKPEDDENDHAQGSPTEKLQTDEPKSMKMVTSEVLKRAENAIFQKAINAIRPIEIKKISESRKILYQNPEPKVLEAVEPTVASSGNREPRKSVNVTINVGRNERNVEITEPVKKAKLDRTKFKPVPETYSPTRLSAKERLGEKVEDSKERKISPMKSFLERRDSKSENQSRSRSPRREKRLSSPMLERRIEPSSLNLTSGERKVFLEERKRDKDRGSDRSKDRSDFRSGDRHDLRPDREGRTDCRTDFRSSRSDMKGDGRVDKDREKDRDRERRGRTPPASSSVFKSRTEISKMGLLKSKDDEEEKRRDKKGSREEKKRKKEHRSRSKSKEHKKRKEKKHKKDKEKNQEKKQKHKDSGTMVANLKEKSDGNETKIAGYETTEQPLTESLKKQRKNPRLVSDRKRSILDEASFEPDYSASDSETDGEDKPLLPSKKLKLDDSELNKEIEIKSLKKRSKSTSSEDTSSSSDSTSSDSDSSDESHKKKRKKHKKHKKKKSTKKDSSSDSDTYSDSSDSSTDEERHKKKSKKSKSRSKQSKKKKKSKHK